MSPHGSSDEHVHVCTRVFTPCTRHFPGTPLHDAELGHFLHPCEGDLVCRCTNEKIPYFNAPVYLENKSQIGKVDDIFGPMNEFVSSTTELHEQWKHCVYGVCWP